MFRRRTPAVEPVAGWWNSRWLLALLVLVAAVPLILPETPPLIDLMGHMGRYRIELADPASPLRTTFFSFRWALIANLGIDLLIVPMSAIFGLELGVKLIVMAIPMITVAGMLGVARELHGRVPPFAYFALPLAYSYPFQWGFANFVLSMGLALCLWALWLRLTRLGRFRLRAALFVPLGMALYICHIFGWAVLALVAFASEVQRRRETGADWIPSIWHGGWACLPLAPPLILMVLWRSGDVKGGNADWFYWRAKWVYMLSALRNHDRTIDTFSIWLLFGLIGAGVLRAGTRLSRTGAIAALLLLIAYIGLPRILLSSAYADMRLAPYVVMMALLAMAPRTSSRTITQVLAVLGIAFYLFRLGVTTVNFERIDRLHAEQLRAIEHIKPDSRVFVMVELRCLSAWDSSRMEHLGAMAIVRRGAFVNGQWTAAGAQLLTIKYAPAKGFAEDPTQILRPGRCRSRRATRYPDKLFSLPHNAFDYVWLIDMPRRKWLAFEGLTPVWNGGERGILYRVTGPATAAIETPNGSETLSTR
ncbi:hypothetical protein PQ455_16400 [Sphingomonas naphthae]|uniref:Glycosyltransferase RgtA/B/C/D-like domain-containing protein n=1 Tax=Sphingomonas naphthae TaxID=1813468 RepID=A0ABY7TK78_9SPHN|nr:hypothetical protein [Sphingomonas naphthae]WCT73181.1 hypothetical protein PQ455_16400 [Sphingomonas naphthae]